MLNAILELFQKGPCALTSVSKVFVYFWGTMILSLMDLAID